jgi:hypothetical protein
MSKGPGNVQRALLALFRRRPFAAVPLWELCWHCGRKDDHAGRVSVMRACRAVAKQGALPLTWKTAPGKGAPIIVYRSDNARACARAERLCEGGHLYGKRRTTQWPTGPKPSWFRGGRRDVPVSAGPHPALKAVASARLYLLGQNIEPTLENIVACLAQLGFGERWSRGEIAVALTEVVAAHA